MKSILSVALLLVSAVALAAPTPQHQTQYWMKLKAKDKFERTTISNLGLSIDAISEGYAFVTGNAHDLELAKKSGRLEVSFALTEKMLDFPKEDSDFHNYKELSDELQKLASQYPQIAKFNSIGKSLEGRDLMMLTISTATDDQSLPAVFYMGGHHAREHVSVETPFLFAQYLLNHYASGDKRIVDLLNKRTVYILPSVNPDGSEYDISSGDYQMWRKNRRDNGDGTTGVDLNRNYGYKWGQEGASDNSDSETYHGVSAFSEPETQAIKAFFESHKNIAIDLSFHTYSELILYPWGHKYEPIEKQDDYLVHKTMAEKMATWNHYTPQQSSELYVTSGDTTDWAYGQLGLISFTFELDPSGFGGGGFYPGEGVIQSVFEKNLEPCLYLLEFADNPYRVLKSKSEEFGLSSPILQ